MIEFQKKDGSIIFSVRVVPRSSKSEIVGEHDGALKVKLASPPVDGAANAELVKLMAKEFGVSRGDVAIISGGTSKLKRISITGSSNEKIETILQAKN